MVYDVATNNMTAHPRAFFALYIGPNNSGTSHTVFKLSTKRLVTTPKLKPKPMAEDIIIIVNNIGIKAWMLDEIQFQNIDHNSIF